MSVLELPIELVNGCFHLLTTGPIWQADCEYEGRPSNCSRRLAMLGQLMNIPTDTLIDMLYIILAGDFAITPTDAAEIEQIQRELQRRGGEQCWSSQAVN